MSNLTLYFKSGNVVTIDKVRDWSVSTNGETITSLTILQQKEGFFKCRKRIIVKSIDLKEIDCIIEH